MHCWAQCPPLVFFVSLGVTLDSAEIPFAGQRTGHVKTDRFRGDFRGHFRGHPRGSFRGDLSWGVLEGLNQRKTKGQQLKGKIVSALFHTFWHFSIGTGKRGHYERGLFAGEISRISKISRFSRISRKWSESPFFSTVWGFSRNSRISKFSRISRKWTFLKRPLFQKTPFSEPDSTLFTLFQSYSEFFLQDFFLELRGFTAVFVQW